MHIVNDLSAVLLSLMIHPHQEVMYRDRVV